MKSQSTSTTTLANRSTLSVRQLDHLDYAAKLRHWMRDDAWSPGGQRLRFENPDYGIGDVTVVDGNITKATPLIGRPCFGIPTALLRNEHATRFVEKRGRLPTGRCQNCKAKDACRWVVTNRLRSHPALETAWTEWLQEGGPHAFEMPAFKSSFAYRCWTALCRELQRHPFTSVNDQNVVAEYAERDRIHKEKEKDRKAKDRRRARRIGELDQVDLDLLKSARDRRARTLAEAKMHDSPPKALVRVRGTSLIELLDVWLGREILRARGIRPTLGKIARWIENTGRRNESATPGALETRVARDLGRIGTLEKVPWEGGVLLPPLDKHTEFPSDITNNAPAQTP